MVDYFLKLHPLQTTVHEIRYIKIAPFPVSFRRSVPPILYDEKTGVFPIEIVHYVIEVKSKATNSEVNDAIEKGKKLRQLRGNQPHSAFFAFSSDLTQKAESDRFINPQAEIKALLPLNILIRPKVFGVKLERILYAQV